jgi:Flp pilus assembly protein TadD
LIHGRGGDLERAGEAFARAVRILPDYAAAHLNLGVAFFRQGRFEEAEPPLRKALLQDPSLARAWATLGHLRHREGRFAEAAACYRRAVGLGMREVAPDLEAALERAGDRLRP